MTEPFKTSLASVVLNLVVRLPLVANDIHSDAMIDETSVPHPAMIRLLS